LDEAKVMAPEVGEDLVALDEALDRLAARDVRRLWESETERLADARRPAPLTR
jgi:hypothetical protein